MLRLRSQKPPKQTLLELPPIPAGVTLIVRLRRPALAGLFAACVMPNILSAAVDHIMPDRDKVSKASFAEMMELHFGVAEAVIVEPCFEDIADLLTKQHLDIVWRYLTEPARVFVPLVQSSKFFGLAMNCKRWSTRPSKVMRVKDPYTAYCLDDAAAYLLSLVEGGAEPSYLHELSEREKDRMHEQSMAAALTRCRSK